MTTHVLRLLMPGSVAAPRDDVPTAQMSDEVLLRESASGDAEAFRTLMTRYEPRVRQFVMWYAGERHAVDDVVQEVFLQTFRSARSFRGQSSVKTWLYALARNVCRNHCRDRVHNEIAVDDEVLEQIPHVVIDPLAMLQREETIAAVRAAVNELPADARIVLTLRDWEQLSYAEIADVLSIPVGTVRSRLHNARARLAAALAERGYAR